MLSKKDKKQFKTFYRGLFFLALTLFILTMITKLYLFTIIGWIALLSAWYIKFWYIPKNTKKIKEETIPSTPTKSIFIQYWEKFIIWLHT